MTRVELLLALTKAGMIQFGRFTSSYGEPSRPVQFHFTLLPSFPRLISAVAEQFSWHLRETIPDTKLLATYQTIALGGVVGLRSHIPLLYPLYQPQSPAYSIEGTADVDNPLIMLTDVLFDGTAELALHQQSARIGLPVQQILALMDTGRNKISAFSQQFQVAALYTLSESIDWIEAEGWIPHGIADRVREWQQES